MRVKLNYNQPPQVAGQPKNPTPQFLTMSYIQYAVHQKYPTIKGQLMRVWGRIQTKLQEAIEKDLETIELETTEIEFLQKCVTDETPFPSEIARFVMVLQDEIDTLKDEEKSLSPSPSGSIG